MKIKATILTAALTLFAVAGTTALAKDKVHTINFDQNVTVNGTVVKKGVYQAKFNEQTGEFSIMDGKKVIATTKAKEESLDKKAEGTSFDLRSADGSQNLTKVTFDGARYTLLIGDAQTAEGQ
jgi:cytochrome c-type biogenesis protein CcmE